MGLMKSLRKRRSDAKAAVKAAKARAKAEVKADSKARARREKLLAKQKRAIIKDENKGLKSKRKHQEKMAKMELDKLQTGKFNADNIKRFAGASRVLLPLALPLIYRCITAAQDQFSKRTAQRSGVTPEQMARFSGHGADLKARIQGIRNSLQDTSVKPGYKRDINERLDELKAAVDNAEFMTDQQRRRAHRSVSNDIDLITEDIQRNIAEG